MITFGCSNTYGHGLKDCFDPPYGYLDKPSKYAWPSILADFLGITNLVNLSKPGCSNKYISHSAKLYPYSNHDIVVILWTHNDRTGFFTNSRLYKNIGPWVESNYSKKFLKTYYSEYDLKFQNSLFQDYQKLYFRQNKIRYFYDCIDEHEKTNDIEYLNLEYQNHRQQYPKALDGTHMGEQGHYDFAKKCFEHIKNII